MNLYRRAYLIYNPIAGRVRRKPSLLHRAMRTLAEAGHRVTVVPTTGPGTAGALAREALASGADLLLVAGGDGTFNEVVNGIAGSEVPVAILPAGTANVLANELGFGNSMLAVAAKVASLKPHRVALGHMVNGAGVGRYFALMAGLGLDAHIVYNLNLDFKRVAGKLAYYASGFAVIGKRLPEFPVVVNGERHVVSFALVSRVRNYGGDLWLARGASLFEDAFEIVLFEGEHALRYLRYFAGAVAGQLQGMSGVRVFKSTALEAFANEGVYVQLDGEYAGGLPARIRLEPGALTLLTPPAR